MTMRGMSLGKRWEAPSDTIGTASPCLKGSLSSGAGVEARSSGVAGEPGALALPAGEFVVEGVLRTGIANEDGVISFQRHGTKHWRSSCAPMPVLGIPQGVAAGRVRFLRKAGVAGPHQRLGLLDLGNDLTM